MGSRFDKGNNEYATSYQTDYQIPTEQPAPKLSESGQVLTGYMPGKTSQ